MRKSRYEAVVHEDAQILRQLRFLPDVTAGRCVRPPPLEVLGLAGLSPRARGRTLVLLQSHTTVRTIPACAGPTQHPCRGRARHADHPRVRGADRLGELSGVVQRGPSPRTRGRHGAQSVQQVSGGTIPAYAGPTYVREAARSRREDHPRVRGADGAFAGALIGLIGPSPRTRGRRPRRIAWHIASRTIPAYAGPTVYARSAPSHQVDHPRVRGADPRRREQLGVPGGPSPRTRGRPPAQAHASLQPWTIPAYAGPT